MSNVDGATVAGPPRSAPSWSRRSSDRRGTPVSIAGLERRPCAYRTSFALEELDVALADGTRLRLMLKDLSRAALHEDALAAKPEFLYDPMREIDVYRDLLDGAGLGTAEYYGSSIDPARDRWWLFIENVVGDALWQIGEFDVWEEAARWLARMHGALAPAAWHGRRAAAALRPRAARRLGTPCARVRRRSAQSVEHRRSRQRIRELAARYDAVTEQLAALAPTFIHGEFYPSNVLVQQGGRTPRVCPIDWEIAAVGPGLLDLAALSVGKWTDAERARLAVAYRAAAAPVAETAVAPVG